MQHSPASPNDILTRATSAAAKDIVTKKRNSLAPVSSRPGASRAVLSELGTDRPDTLKRWQKINPNCIGFLSHRLKPNQRIVTPRTGLGWVGNIYKISLMTQDWTIFSRVGCMRTSLMQPLTRDMRATQPADKTSCTISRQEELFMNIAFCRKTSQQRPYESLFSGPLAFTF